MSLLMSDEIFKSICKELRLASSSVQILTAYGKRNAISNIIDNVNDTVIDKKIMLRFRLDDLIKGSTDFEILDLCLDKGWKVFIRFDLHAKTYVIDNKRGIVGSANATNSGLSLKSNSNYEIAVLADINESDMIKINNLFNDAIFVSKDIRDKLHDEFCLALKQDRKKEKSIDWSKEIKDMFNPRIEVLFSHELPEKGMYNEGEVVQFLDINEYNRQSFIQSFQWSKPYLWLIDVLKQNGGKLFFGELTEKLHNIIIEDPKPYRKEVKEYLQNLLSLIEKHDMSDIVIDRPNHSQRISIK